MRLGVPGFSVTWIDQDKILDQKAFGLANVAENIPVTTFTLGSTTKLILGTSVAQQVDQQHMSLQDKLSDFNLGFSIDSPYQDMGEATLEALPEYHLSTWADGGLSPSATDMARFLLAVVKGGTYDQAPILSPDATDLMLTPLTDLPYGDTDTGIQWQTDDLLIGHDGSDPGVLSGLRYDRHHDIGYIFLMNATSREEFPVGEEHTKEGQQHIINF